MLRIKLIQLKKLRTKLTYGIKDRDQLCSLPITIYPLLVWFNHNLVNKLSILTFDPLKFGLNQKKKKFFSIPSKLIDFAYFFFGK